MFGLDADISLRILAAAAAVGLVLVVLRVRSGAARHAAWLAVLLAMLTMPVLTASVPRVEVPVPSTLVDFGRRAGSPDPYEPVGTPVSPDFTDLQPSLAVTSSALEAKESPIRFTLDRRSAAVALYAAGRPVFFVRLGGGGRGRPPPPRRGAFLLRPAGGGRDPRAAPVPRPQPRGVRQPREPDEEE